MPTELFDTINIFCSVEEGPVGGTPVVLVLPALVVALGVGERELRGVAPVCIIRGMLVSVSYSVYMLSLLNLFTCQSFGCSWVVG